MPCYDGHREDERIDRETAAKVEAVLCAMIGTFGFENLDVIDWNECGVSQEWVEGWWREHQKRDAFRKENEAVRKEVARKQAILDSGDYKTLHQMITKPVDIHATVRALQNSVPAGCETLAPPCPTASGVPTTYYGDVRLIETFDPIEGLMIRRADISTTGKCNRRHSRAAAIVSGARQGGKSRSRGFPPALHRQPAASLRRVVLQKGLGTVGPAERLGRFSGWSPVGWWLRLRLRCGLGDTRRK